MANYHMAIPLHIEQYDDYNMQINSNNRIKYAAPNLSTSDFAMRCDTATTTPIKEKYYRKLSLWRVRISHTLLLDLRWW